MTPELFPSLIIWRNIYLGCKWDTSGNKYQCFQYLDADSIEEIFRWSKGAILESIIHVEDYWNVLYNVGKKNIFSCKVLNDRRCETWLDVLRMVDIKGTISCVHKRCTDGPKNDKFSLRRLNMK